MKKIERKAASISMELDCDFKETKEALRTSNNDDQTAAGIIQCNRKLLLELLENELSGEQKLTTPNSESHKVITKKYAALKIEKADLLKELRNMSDIQIKNKSLEEQLLKAGEENGDEPGLIIDDKVLDDEPSTSTSHVLPTELAGRSLSSRDPRRKSAEARQASEATNLSSTAKPSSPAKIPVSGRSLSSRDPKSTEARQASEATDSSSTEPNSSKKMPGGPSKLLKEGDDVLEASQAKHKKDTKSLTKENSQNKKAEVQPEIKEDQKVENDKIQKIQTTFLLITNNESHMLISEENLKDITFGNPETITELGI